MNLELSDGQLLAGIKAGDQTAWSELVRRHARHLWAVARAQGLEPSLASDVVQTTWLILMDKAHDIRKEDSVRFYLMKVARREAIRVSKQQRRLGDDAALPFLTETASSDERNRVEIADQLDALRRVFGTLSAKCQELFRLMFSDADLSYREIAEVLDSPVGSLGPQRGRCLDELRGLLHA